MSGYNNLCRKMEAVLHGHLTGYVTGRLQVLKMMDAIGVQNLPDERIEIACTGSRPFTDMLDARSGATNRYVACSIKVITRADVKRNEAGTPVGDARDRHDDEVGTIMDAFYIDGLAAELNGVGIANIQVDDDIAWPVEAIAVNDGRYETTITFEALAHSVG